MKQFLILNFLLVPFLILGQSKSVDWLTFPELERMILKTPKKTLIYFYADWCTYCKKMERDVYTKPEIIEALNKGFYSVKFNVESKDTIAFGGKTFINLNIGKKRQAYHQIAELLASQDGKPLTLPAVVILSEAFTIESRYFNYLDPKALLRILK